MSRGIEATLTVEWRHGIGEVAGALPAAGLRRSSCTSTGCCTS
ncbi:hypothetical protein [Sciscionella marina]|nr:hypothetical protein [Sciscionella marina]